MSGAVRFLAIIVVGWVGVRVAGASLLPETGLVAEPAKAAPTLASKPPVAPPPAMPQTAATASENVPAGAVWTPYGLLFPFAGEAPPPILAQAAPVTQIIREIRYVPAPRTARSETTYRAYPDARLDPRLAGYSLASFDASVARPATLASPVPPPVMTGARDGLVTEEPAGFDRWQLSAWSFMRATGMDSASPGLAPGSMLGGDQSGARLLYRFNPELAVSARISAATGSVRGTEAALGLRYQPLQSLPLALTIERRERIDGGDAARSDFAAFLEGGVYREVPAGLTLESYAQAGLVGVEDPDWFVDGALTLSRPIFRQVSVGAGVWGAAQPGVERLDVGPRISMPVWQGVRAHADYRWRIAGEAEPGDGPTVTIAADF
ncbi:hypothetical protein [Sphingomicrobium sediminis]|uniref:Uncharacterized protein n=1 Tax=Sphingomicrobium sediminis TaxID=2950949 RepID=A0A9X2EH86_9SPHN|nr:hypothetical protein [Sphingomicrobium sediminis]MCM8557970.1 hypothetical protein [Sphingomicrobium sediminis]